MSSIRYNIAFTYILIASLSFMECNHDVSGLLDSQLTIESVVAVNGNKSVKLGWTGIENGTAVELQIHRSVSKEVLPVLQTLIVSLPSSARTFTDTAVVNNQTYYYTVVPVEEVAGGMRRLGSSGEATMARPYDYSTVGEISFSQHIQPIFLSGCGVNGCHVGADPVSIAKRDGIDKISHNEQFSLKNWEDFFKGGSHGALIVPYRANKSHLIFHMNKDTLIAPVSLPHMPSLTGMDIPADQFNLIMRWIDEGASNDDGAVAFSTYPEGKVLATNQAEDVVAIIDVKTQLVARYIQAGLPNVTPGLQPQSPHNLIVDQANGYYYVNLVNAGKVIKYRLSDNVKLGEVTGITSPTQIALTATGDTGFVAQFFDNAHAIRMFDTRTMQLFPQTFVTPLMSKPHGVQLTPDGQQVYITGNLSDNVIILDIATGGLSLIWMDANNPQPSTNFLPYQTVMTNDNKFAYVSCQRSNDVRVIDRDSMKVVKIIPVGLDPLIMAITPDNQYIYVANRNSNSVSVIRTSDNTVSATIADVGPQPHGVAIDKNGKYAYITCENVGGTGPPPHHPTSGSKAPGYVVVIDIATNGIVKTIEVANFAAGIAVVQ